MRVKTLLIIPFFGLIAACDSADTPLDAGTRQRIDSTAAAQIRMARIELDSVCAGQRNTELSRLVDSIKNKRLQEIERQLRTVPK